MELLFDAGSRNANSLSTKRTVSIQLEVLNGTGEAKIAQKVTNVLRSSGFDVVDMGNYKSANVPKTLVIGRTTDKAAAQSVASFLGVDASRVLQQPDKYLYLDVSVVIGKDINQLRIFK